MRHFSVSLLVASVLFSSTLASPPHAQRQTAGFPGFPGFPPDPQPSGVTDNDGDGNIPDLGDGNGIPDVSNATNPACIPWYGIRDAILGGIFHGRLTTLLFSKQKLTSIPGRCGDNPRAAVRLAFHDAGTSPIHIAC
jgi:hypothetical protein